MLTYDNGNHTRNYNFVSSNNGYVNRVIFNRKPLSGSCGGLNPNGECSICGGDTNKCDNSNLESVST